MTTIQCHCGAVKFELTGDPVAQFYCHCDDCQLVHSAAYVPIAMYKAEQVRPISGTPTKWKLKNNPRTMCPGCGTRMFAEPPGMGVAGVVAYLLPKGTFKPAFHIQCQHALLPIKDDLPHFKGFPGAFGGSDDQVSW
jgi:hypothetical protein